MSHLEYIGIRATWKKQASDMLRDLLKQGHTYKHCSEVLSDRFNSCVTREACIGFSKRNFAEFENRGQQRPVKPKTISKQLEPAKIIAHVAHGNNWKALIDKSGKIARIEDLQTDGCKFIGSSQKWCNCERYNNSPYCKEHFTACYPAASAA